MRKGRSSRRSRVSRPLIGVKVPPVSTDALSTEIGRPSNPRVIVGVPPSDPPPASAPESLPPPSVEARGTVDGIVPSLPPTEGVDPLDALETLETPSELPPAAETGGATAAEEEREEEREAQDEKTQSFASLGSTIAPESTPPEPRDETSSAPLRAASTIGFGTATDGEPATAKAEESNPARDDAKEDERAASEHVEAAPAVETTDPDEISVPPVGDVGVDEEFFSEGDVSRHLAGDGIEGDSLTIPDTAKRKSEPHVVERRARFVRYVKWAVAGAAVVCLAAAARTTMTASTSATAARSGAAITTNAVEAAPAAPKAAVQAAAPIATAVETPAAKGAAPEPAPTERANAAAASAEAPAPETNAEAVTGDAKEEKTLARTLLEKRKIADAIEAGERSVKLDPSDGEAWLILGAAYQDKGNMVEARRAYASCVKEATSGPRHECAKMLR